MIGAVQLDLFGEVEAGEQAAARRAAWTARFERAEWVALVERRGKLVPDEWTRCLGYRCPDPECGEVEPNAYLLVTNHGFDPETPGIAARDGRCGYLRRAAERGERPMPEPIPGWES